MRAAGRWWPTCSPRSGRRPRPGCGSPSSTRSRATSWPPPGRRRRSSATAPLRPPALPRGVCPSVNDAILHGIPTAYGLGDGDLLTVDFGATLDGWVGDSAITFSWGPRAWPTCGCGSTRRRRPAAGIAAAVVGDRVGDISAAVGTVCRAGGYGIRTDLGGHGVGRPMHEAPSVPNEGRPAAASPRPRPGARDRAQAPRRRLRRLRGRPRRLDPAHRRRLPRRPHRAHGRRHPDGPGCPRPPRR